MARRSTKKPPQPTTTTTNPNNSPTDSPPKFKFNFTCFKTTTSTYSSPMKNKNTKSSTVTPAVISPVVPKMTSLNKPPHSIADLKEIAAANVDSIKRHLDFSHSEILKDVEASQSRLHKRFKIQNQACQQTMNEAEKEFKKMNDRIKEARDAMQASYKELIAESQASTNRGMFL
ncbi:hypothetical protein CTI12_AA378040 [Artemisia annua]|uniref:Uncharacterized protein n=1 Tax=Artemisia annua TaxID=35608 RepID=A0A2U1MI70_ARTAN|nr:hypothetical protein CTI12_AA378040 [Artemisia annua]